MATNRPQFASRWLILALLLALLLPALPVAIATSAPTLVKGINTTPNPTDLIASGGLLYFVNASPGSELWRSDGTDAGDCPGQDISPGPFAAFPTAGVALDYLLIILPC